MQFHRKVFSNGLRLITIPMPSFESATVMVMVGAGSRYENKNNSGISHFLEHMAFKGTKKRPSPMIISNLIDGMGGEFNAFTGKETTGYYIKSSSDKIEISFDVISDMLINSNLDPSEIEKEKGVILEEINLYEDTPARKITDLYEVLLYGDSPMGWNIAGDKEVIKSLNRADFINYMKSLYSAGNTTLVIAGGISTKAVLGLAEKYFSQMTNFDTLKYSKAIESQTKPNFLLTTKKTEQAHIALGFRTVSLNHPDKYPLEVLSALLGGGMSSRLFTEVREKRGLGYYVRSSLDAYMDTGTIVSYAGVDPRRITEAVEVMLGEYADIKSKGKKKIRNEELQKAKEFIKGHFVLELEDSRSVASFYAHQELLEKSIESPSEVIEKIDSVTIEDVEKVAKKYIIESSLNLAILGNFTDGKKFGDLLKL